MAKAKAKRKNTKSKKSTNTGLMRLFGLALILGGGYLFWQSVTASDTTGTSWWVKSLAEAVVLLYGLYVFATGKVDLSDLVQNV